MRRVPIGLIVSLVAAAMGCSTESQSRELAEAETPEAAAVRSAPAPADPAAGPAEIPFPAAWGAIFPCADCDGVFLEVELLDADRYRLTQTYQGTPAGERRFELAGSWRLERGVEGDPAALVLRLEDAKVSRAFVVANGGEALDLLDREGRRILTDLPNRLERLERAVESAEDPNAAGPP